MPRFESEVEAKEFAEPICPKGWRVEVWHNLHWCVAWRRGPVAVYPSYVKSDGDMFHALLCGDDPAKRTHCSGDCDWTTSRSHPTILEAAKAEIASFRRRTARKRRIWDAIELECQAIEHDMDE